MARPTAPIGGGRVRSIIGKVFVPMGLAVARHERDRAFEERVLEFFAVLPKEPENRILKIMLPRVYGDTPPKKMDFPTQQGLIQMYQDWCEPNPSCKNCRVMSMLDQTATHWIWSIFKFNAKNDTISSARRSLYIGVRDAKYAITGQLCR